MQKPERNIKINQSVIKEKKSKQEKVDKKTWYRNIFNQDGLNSLSTPLQFIVSLAIALAVWLITGLLLINSNLGFFWQEFFRFFLALLILVSIAFLTGQGKMGATIITLIFIIFVVRVLNHDFPQREKVEKVEMSKIEKRENIKTDLKKADFLRLGPGTHIFYLDAKEETPWRGFPNGKVSAGGFFSEDYDYTIIFNDGSSYPGGANTKIPVKKHCFWKIKAHSPQTVYVTVL